MKHQEVSEETQEKAALYALGALSQHETRAFEDHLHEGCDVCKAELSEFQDVISALDAGVAEEAPPAYIRDLLAARISREPQIESPQIESPQIESPQIAAQRPAQPVAVRKEAAQPAPVASGSRRIIPWTIAAALAIAALALFLSWRQARQDADSTRQQLASARSESEDLRAQVGQLQGDPKVIRLVGQAPAPGASAQIYWDVAKRNWVVSANLPPAPEGKVYQLWFVTPDAKINAGLIKPDDKGYGFSVINLPSDLAGLVAAAITLEPEGGSVTPTLPIYAVGETG